MDLQFLAHPSSPENAIAALCEPVRGWFRQRFMQPTSAQCLAFPTLAAGKHLLLCAPTGNGKTLAAFAPILGDLLSRAPTSGIACLYLSPLKALGNDTRRSLRSHLESLREHADRAGTPLTRELRVGLRTGDTSVLARRQMREDPPDILLTTPESLAVLLSQPTEVDLFRSLRWIVVDELHALATCKRGADLSLSLERLTTLYGERIQRIGLSATCVPVEDAARFLVGGNRPCVIAQAPDSSPLTLTIENLPTGPSFLNALATRLEPELRTHRSTLIFTNMRGLAERLSWTLRRRFPEWDHEIAVHHSALAAGRRRRVERQFKRGRLRAVVCSTSLELGIDIGTVDMVVLCRPPGGVVRLLQRVGRAGHGPGQARRGLLLTENPAELIESAVTAVSAKPVGNLGLPARCEPLQIPKLPLDVLCQQLLGMAAHGFCEPEPTWEMVRRAYPYRDLSRADFDACLDYLSGRHADGRSWLPARLRWQDDCFTIADQRTARVLRRNIGTILAEEALPVVVAEDEDDRRLVGQVDEIYAERLEPGDRFLLDGRCLEFRRIEQQSVIVHEVVGRPVVPRWTGDGLPIAPDLARRLYLFRVQAAEALRDGPDALAGLLRGDWNLGGDALATLCNCVERQESASEIPDGMTLLIEAVRNEAGADYYLHTPLNRAGNDALARVTVRRLGGVVKSLVTDLGLALFVRGRSGPAPDLGPDDWRRILSANAFEADLVATLEESDALRERFRRVALTGLMLLQHPIGGRRKVGGRAWGERRLFDRIRSLDPDFVLLRQARRETVEEVCDLGNARAYLEELPRMQLRLRWLAFPSPFVENWVQLDMGPSESVESPADALRRLHAALTFGETDDASTP